MCRIFGCTGGRVRVFTSAIILRLIDIRGNSRYQMLQKNIHHFAHFVACVVALFLYLNTKELRADNATFLASCRNFAGHARLFTWRRISRCNFCYTIAINWE